MARRAKHHVSHHPRLITKIVHGVGLLTAFNQGIQAALGFMNPGALSGDNPRNILVNVVWRETGFNAQTGTWDMAQFGASVGSKVAGYIWVKLAMHFVKKWRM